ncbi:hypothetical protein [Tabrizicola sp.]|uniref:hypothetical protein n=1 Tax=Tabrizicola sp. TaxID=2005166 RepID=UPI00286A41CF|nr:hypothetical protein [Tabrizicola sp.]
MAPKFMAETALVDIALKDNLLYTVLAKPPAWTRLEPQSVSGDPAPGIAARLHDPLWLIGRQWQMGEFRGEDCGTPVSVRLRATTQGLTALRPGGPDKGHAPVALDPDAVFEPAIEAEPWAAPTLRDRAEAAQALVAALAPLGWGGEAVLLAECPFDLAAPDLAAQAPDAAWVMIAHHLPDAEAAALALEGGAPGWLAGEAVDVIDAAAAWLEWYRRNVSLRTHAADSWHAKRLEYRFGLQSGTGPKARRLEAPCHLGGPVEWYSVDLAEGAGLGLAAPASMTEHRAHVHATGLRYAGMPANRMWQFEDGQVNFGVTDVQPNDLARLVFLEYATIYGNDWLVAPIDLPRGVLARVEEVSYTTTFGETFTVDPAADAARRGRFRLYATDAPGGTEPCFVIPPNSRAAIEAAPREEVVFARDETANVVWAIERSVEGADGLARDRASAAAPVFPVARPGPGADLAWTLESLPPDYWIPMVPVPNGGGGGFFLRKGSFDGTDSARGRVLAPVPFDLFDEEVPREGVRLARVPSVLRDERGRLNRWIARRVFAAWGEGRSRLAYDVTSGPSDDI